MKGHQNRPFVRFQTNLPDVKTAPGMAVRLLLDESTMPDSLRKVLICEDDETISLMMTRALERAEFLSHAHDCSDDTLTRGRKAEAPA